MLSGRIPDGRGGELARGFALRLAVVAMGNIKQAFIVKARGGTDEAGDKWKPLAPSTIEKRMRKGKAGLINRRRVKAGAAVRKAERDVRKAETFRKTLVGEIRLHAAQQRLETAKRKYAEAAGSIEILKDTGRMYHSLSPSAGGFLLPDGRLEAKPGLAAFGTNVQYAHFHHFGGSKPGRPPQRRLWPETSRWPQTWWEDLREAARTGMKIVSAQLLRGAA